MKILNKNWIIDLQKTILWQYDKAEKLQALINSKQVWYKQKITDFIVSFFYNIFNIRTATDFGLNIWGKILNFSRQVVNKNDGTIINLTTEQYRFLLLGQILKFKMDCTVPEINRYLALIFNDNEGRCYVQDNQNMTIQYIIGISVPTEIQALLDNVDFLPRPAGVRTIVGDTVYYTIRLNVYDNFGNLVTDSCNINYSWDEGAETASGGSVTVPANSTVVYTVEKEGYESQSDTIANISDDHNIDINLVPNEYSFTLSVTPSTATITLTVNDEDVYTGTGSISKNLGYGDRYTYTITATDYQTITKTGTITQTTAITETMLSLYGLYKLKYSSSASGKTTVTQLSNNARLSDTSIVKAYVPNQSGYTNYLLNGRLYKSDGTEVTVNGTTYSDWTDYAGYMAVRDSKLYFVNKEVAYLLDDTHTYRTGTTNGTTEVIGYGITTDNKLYRIIFSDLLEESMQIYSVTLVNNSVSIVRGNTLPFDSARSYFITTTGELYSELSSGSYASLADIRTTTTRVGSASNWTMVSGWATSFNSIIGAINSLGQLYAISGTTATLLYNGSTGWTKIYGEIYGTAADGAYGINNGNLYIIRKSPSTDYIVSMIDSEGWTDVSGGANNGDAYGIKNGALYYLSGGRAPVLIDNSRVYVSVAGEKGFGLAIAQIRTNN